MAGLVVVAPEAAGAPGAGVDRAAGVVEAERGVAAAPTPGAGATMGGADPALAAPAAIARGTPGVTGAVAGARPGMAMATAARTLATGTARERCAGARRKPARTATGIGTETGKPSRRAVTATAIEAGESEGMSHGLPARPRTMHGGAGPRLGRR